MALPVCEVWFDALPAEPGVTVITEPHTNMFLRSNAWLVTGRDRDLLVDAGNGIGLLTPFLDGLREDPAKPLVAVATHCHMDHAGGLWEFEDRRAHVLDAPDIERPVSLLLGADVWPGPAGQMAEAGFPVADVNVTAAPRAGWDPAAFEPRGARLTRSIGEGGTVDLGDRTFEVMHLPGHTAGSIGLWEGPTGTLFCGDAVYAGDPLIDTAPTSDVGDYLATMRRLRELPVRAAHGGHDVSMDRETFAARCEAYLATRA